jgi:hypothetical protein
VDGGGSHSTVTDVSSALGADGRGGAGGCSSATVMRGDGMAPSPPFGTPSTA